MRSPVLWRVVWATWSERGVRHYTHGVSDVMGDLENARFVSGYVQRAGVSCLNGETQRFGAVVHEEEASYLRTIALQRGLLSIRELVDECRDESAGLPRSEHVKEAEH